MVLRRWSGWLPFALLSVLLLVWLWPLLVGESLFWGLPTLQFYPWRSYAFDEILAGRLPLWNPYSGGGAPLLANYQTAVFYPPNWLHLVLPHVTAMNVLAVGHIMLAGAGMWLFTACWSTPTLGRGVSTLAFAASGYLVARLGSFPTVAAAAWLPWLFRDLHLLLVQRSRMRVMRLGLVTAMLLLAGHAQTAFYALLAAGAYAVWLGIMQKEAGHFRLRGWALTGGGILLGVGMAAVQLLPTAELLARSARADGLHYEWATNFSYSLARALTLIVPNLYGTPADGSYLTEGAYFEDTAYIGLLPLIAGLAACAQWWRTRKDAGPPVALTAVPFWAGMAMMAFLIALGKNGFLFPLLYASLPFFRAFQGPVRWLLLTVFGLSMLAGTGVSYAWGRGKWPLFWSRLAVAGGGGMALVAAFVAPRLVQGIGDFGQVMTRALIILGVAISGCALLFLMQPEDCAGRRHRVWQAAILVFLAGDLGLAFRGLNPTVPAAFFVPQSGMETPETLWYMPQDLEQRLTYSEYFSFKDYRLAGEHWPELRQSLLPNLNMIDRVRMFNNFDPIVTQAHAEAVSTLEARLPEGSDSMIVLEPGEMPAAEPFGLAAVQGCGFRPFAAGRDCDVRSGTSEDAIKAEGHGDADASTWPREQCSLIRDPLDGGGRNTGSQSAACCCGWAMSWPHWLQS
jgi:hypothetical protein